MFLNPTKIIALMNYALFHFCVKFISNKPVKYYSINFRDLFKIPFIYMFKDYSFDLSPSL